MAQAAAPATLVGGRKILKSIQPIVTVGAYSAGQVVGGILKLDDILTDALTGYIVNGTLSCKIAAFTGPVDVFIFNKQPVGTYNDNAAFNLNASDIDALQHVVQFNQLFATGTGAAILQATPNAYAIRGNDANVPKTLWAVIVTRAGVTFTSAADILMKLMVDQD